MNPIEIVKKQSKIKDINPVQKLALENGLLEGANLVVSSPTASGKTIIAEFAIINNWINKKGKSIYIVPLRALAYEKYDEFKEKYSELGLKIGVSTGDLDSTSDYLENKDLIVLTSEKLDSLLRHQASWLSQTSLVIADEAHLLTEPSRGPTLEIVLTLLKENLTPQIIALSATISNADEIAEWLNANLIISDYRPVPLEKGIFSEGKLILENKTEDTELDLISFIKKVVKRGKQVLIFLSTRKNTESFAEKLSKEFPLVETEIARRVLNALETPTKQCKKEYECLKHSIAFHHAGLLQNQKTLIEKGFREGKIKVICATTTLAMGLNLPSFLVIVKDTKRYSGGYSRYLPNFEIQQMCLSGNSKILLANGEEMEIEKIVKNKLNRKVISFNGKNYTTNRIINYFKRRASKIVKIKTDIGRELKLTEEHPIFVNNHFKEAKYIKKGDKLAICNFENIDGRELPFFFEFLPKDTYVIGLGHLIKKAKHKLKITEKQLSNKLGYNYKISYHYKNNIKAMPLDLAIKLGNILDYDKDKIASIIGYIKSPYGTKIKIPKKISTDFLWFCGLVATDGNLNRPSNNIRLRIFNKNIKIINKAKKILSDLGIQTKIYTKSGYYIDVGATMLSKILNKFGIPYNHKTSSVKVPTILYSANKKYIGAYLSGVFDGDGNYYNNRILFITSSKKFALGLQDLLLRLGILSKLKIDRKTIKTKIRGKEYEFRKPKYYIYFHKKNEVNKFLKYAKPVKYKIKRHVYSDDHNIDKFFNREENLLYSKVRDVKIVNLNIPVYNLEIENDSNYFVSSFLVHNCGRAGRPRYDKVGLGILVAKNPGEVEELKERYLHGEIEPITSKLAIEPVLRMHTLSLIASEFVHSTDKLLQFFQRTFFGHTYGADYKLQERIENILLQLERFGFIDLNKFRATRIGRRVSELYLDPLSAHRIITAIEKASLKTQDLFYLQIICYCPELYPLLRVKNKELPNLDEFIAKNEDKFLMEVPSSWDFEYNFFLESLKTALMLKDWISEITEEKILERYGITPGELYTKKTNSEWLLYAAQEFAKLKGKRKIARELRKLEIRMNYGIKEELLDLIRMKGIGRIRARRLYNFGIKKLADIKNQDRATIERLIGKKVLDKLLGE